MFPDLTRDDVFRIETRSLWLRWPVARDAEAIVALAGDREIAERTARIPHPFAREDADSFLIAVRGANTAGSSLTMALARRAAPSHLIGVVGIEPHALAPGPHLGYWVGRPHWGEGLMSEASAAMIEAYFLYAGGEALYSTAMTDNAASHRVLGKSGFEATGSAMLDCPARGGARACTTYRLTRARWLERRVTDTDCICKQ